MTNLILNLNEDIMYFIRSTKLNVNLIKNLPTAMKAELITLEDVIPDGINASLCVNDPVYDKKRSDFVNYRPDLIDKIRFARNQRRDLDDVDDRIEFETDRELQFIKDYPQFKPLIESIIYMNGAGNTVKIIPIDEYLAEN